MSPEYLEIFIGVVCLCIGALTQVLFFRIFPKLGLLKSEYIGFISGALVFLLFESYLVSLQAMPTISLAGVFATNLIIYCALGYCYFHFVNLGETARRIRILRELYDAKGGLSLEEILGRYNAKEIVEIRMKRLINNGQVVLRNGRYYIGGTTVLFMARVIDAMKSMLLRKS